MSTPQRGEGGVSEEEGEEGEEEKEEEEEEEEENEEELSMYGIRHWSRRY